MKKILFVLLIFIIPILIYNHIGFVRNLIAKALLPSSYKEYGFLSENKVESEEARIVKIIDGELDGDMLFNTVTQEFLVRIRDSDYDKNNQNWHTIWKINEEGKVIDSLYTNKEMNPVGMYFLKDYFIDWVHSGDKTRHKYKKIINFDSISIDETDAYFDEAEMIVYGTNYDDKKLIALLKIDGDWIILESKAEFEKDYERNHDEKFNHKAKRDGILMVLENRITPFYKWGDINSFMHIEKFVEESREHKSFYDINNTSRSGWLGIAYIQLIQNSNFFHFKANAFSDAGISTDYSPNISFFESPKKLGDHFSNIAFIALDNQRKGKRDYKEVGLYVIRNKKM